MSSNVYEADLTNDVPTQAPEKDHLTISATKSEQKIDNEFHQGFNQAQSQYSEVMSHFNISEHQASFTAGDAYEEIEDLKDFYVDVLPKEFVPNKRNALKDVIANTKTGKYPEEVQAALEKELGLEDDSKDGKLDPENADENGQANGPGGGSLLGGIGGLFGSLKKSYTGNQRPLTDAIISNNNIARKQIADLAEASALCRATQGSLKAYLSQQGYDTQKAVMDIRNGQATPEAQQLMSDPMAQTLIHNNDIAMRNALASLNPEKLKAVDTALESGLIDPDLKKQYGESLKSTIEAAEDNRDLPTNDPSALEKVAEAIRGFIDSIKQMFGISPDQSHGLGR